jgi:hypothetical protein
MRSILITAAGASALLSVPAAAQDFEGRGLDRMTTCEVQVTVHTSDFVPVDSVVIFRYGLDPDIAMEGVEFGPVSPDKISLCEALVQNEVPKLCRKNNKRGRIAPIVTFKKLDINPFPEEVCEGPTDPRCLDPLFQQFRMTTFDAEHCADFLSE